MREIFGKSGNIVTKKALVWLSVILVLTVAALAASQVTRHWLPKSVIEECHDLGGVIDRDGNCFGYWVE